MIALKSSWTAKAAFVASLQMVGVKRRELRSRNVMCSMRYALQNKGITLIKRGKTVDFAGQVSYFEDS